MPHVVIIGAGSIGLYLAYKLKKDGIKNIIIYDQRAGEYVRPGHINGSIFRLLENKLGKSFWQKEDGHIKEFERILYDQVRELAIPIEKKRFIRLHQHDQHKGIIVADAAGQEELVECEYLFDCTGSRRLVAHNVNDLVAPKPFTIEPIAPNVRIKNHFLAYVYMNSKDLALINQGKDAIFNADSPNFPYNYVRVMEQFRQLGWHEFDLPYFYGVSFGKGKVCLYLECPDNLPHESYDAWLQASIYGITGTPDIQYKQLAPSKKYTSKPRFGSFTVDPMQVQESAYSAKGLPTIILMGDSQIDPNYVLAHGVRDGLERVDAFIKCIASAMNVIGYFDKEEYETHISDMMNAHRIKIIEHYAERAKHLDKMLDVAEVNYSNELDLTIDEPKNPILLKVLAEIRARIAYRDALVLLASVEDNQHKICFVKSNLTTLAIKLPQLYALLLKASKELPPSHVVERANALTLLKQVATSLRELGNQFVKKSQLHQAIEFYQHALKAYRNPDFNNELLIEAITTQSNMVICYRKLNQLDTAIELGVLTLSNTPDTGEFLIVRKKLLYNVLKAIQESISKGLDDQEQVITLKKDGLDLMDKHSHLLEERTSSDFFVLFNLGKTQEDIVPILDLKGAACA